MEMWHPCSRQTMGERACSAPGSRGRRDRSSLDRFRSSDSSGDERGMRQTGAWPTRRSGGSELTRCTRASRRRAAARTSPALRLAQGSRRVARRDREWPFGTNEVAAPPRSRVVLNGEGGCLRERAARPADRHEQGGLSSAKAIVHVGGGEGLSGRSERRQGDHGGRRRDTGRAIKAGPEGLGVWGSDRFQPARPLSADAVGGSGGRCEGGGRGTGRGCDMRLTGHGAERDVRRGRRRALRS